MTIIPHHLSNTLLMSEEIKVFIIFFIWIVSAYFWGFVSWGISVLSIGMMSFLGISPQLAGITFKLGKVGNSLAWVRNFHSEWLIRKEYLIWLGLTMMLGWWLGSFFIMSISDFLMYTVSAFSMLILVVVALIKKVGWQKNQNITKNRTIFGYFTYFILSFLGNLFPAGSWVWYYFANTFIFKLSTLEWKATGNAVAVFWFIGTAVGIFAQGYYHIFYAMALAIGMYIWWHFATKQMIKIGDYAMRNIILIGIVFFALYFLYLAYNSWQ